MAGRLPQLAALFCLASLASPAAAQATHVLDNGILELSFYEADGTFSIRDLRSGSSYRQFRLLSRSSTTAQVDGMVLSCPMPSDWTGGAVGLDLELELVAGQPELVMRILGSGATLMPSEFEYPTPFVMETPDAVALDTANSGLLYTVRQPDGTPTGNIKTAWGNSMAWNGQTDLVTGEGFLRICETAVDALIHNAYVYPDGVRRYLGWRMKWRPELGLFGYPRQVRWRFVTTGGYVQICKEYRDWAAAADLLHTLADKRVARNEVERVVGCVHAYTGVHHLYDELLEMGISRQLRTGWGWGTAEIHQQILDDGGIPMRYLLYWGIVDPGQREDYWNMDRVGYCTFMNWLPVDGFGAGADAAYHAGNAPWSRGGDPPFWATCGSIWRPTNALRVPYIQSKFDYAGFFIDVLAKIGFEECHRSTHPWTRSDDKAARIGLLEDLTGDSLGGPYVTGSEGGQDWAVPGCDYFEGLLSTAVHSYNEGTFIDDHANDNQVFGHWVQDYVEYEGPVHRAPLFELVFGDCAQLSFWWGDFSDKMPDLWAMKDLLCILHGGNPMWRFSWDSVFLESFFERNSDRYLLSYQNTVPWAQYVGYAEMTDHQMLESDRTVQSASWSNGAEVILNFGPGDYDHQGTALPPEHFLIASAPGFKTLPVGVAINAGARWPFRYELEADSSVTIGGEVELALRAPPSRKFTVYATETPEDVETQYGLWHLGSDFFPVAEGATGEDSRGGATVTIPDRPGLVGRSFTVQAVLEDGGRPGWRASDRRWPAWLSFTDSQTRTIGSPLPSRSPRAP